MMNINLINYKLFSGKYTINISKEKTQEFLVYCDRLIFEGEYLNGKRNGNGKEYGNNGNLIFEGEFINGKRHEKGKEYFNGNLIFEGEFINGKRNGQGKEYIKNNELIFKGEYIDGKRWNGKYYNPHKSEIYELKSGKGYLREYDYNSHLIFEGDFLNGERNGDGKEYYFILLSK